MVYESGELAKRQHRHADLLAEAFRIPEDPFKRPLLGFIAVHRPSEKFRGVGSGAELRKGLEESIRSVEQSQHAFETERAGGTTLKGAADLKKAVRIYSLGLKLHQGMLDLMLKHRLHEL